MKRSVILFPIFSIFFIIGCYNSRSKSWSEEIAHESLTCSERLCAPSSSSIDSCGGIEPSTALSRTWERNEPVCRYFLWVDYYGNDLVSDIAGLCLPLYCWDNPDLCPPGSTCNEAGICIRTSMHVPVLDRASCEVDEDCIPESCCRKMWCTNREFSPCSNGPGVDCYLYYYAATGPYLKACRCIDGCCLTEFYY
jgi:hypothetical protein